jgi:cytochrome c biogenesis protein CcmG, thiol:disulfide interchange protein DsbE
MKSALVLIIILFAATLLTADMLPEFKLPDMSNNVVTPESLMHKGPVLIDFWATWCVPCKKGMVALNQLAQKYDSLTVVVISIDAPKDVPKAKAYLKTNDYKFIALFDSEKQLAKKLNVVNPPRTLILDKTGEIVMSHDGYEPGAENAYEAKIRELLSLPALDEVKEVIPTPLAPESCGQCQ